MARSRIVAVILGLSLLTFLSLGCPYEGAHYPTVYGLPTATPTATPISATVTIAGLVYSPNPVTITRGGSVTWINNDPFGHTVYPDNGAGVCTTNVSITASGTAGATISINFPSAGTISYHCAIHNACGIASCSGCSGSMAATIVVQ